MILHSFVVIFLQNIFGLRGKPFVLKSSAARSIDSEPEALWELWVRLLVRYEPTPRFWHTPAIAVCAYCGSVGNCGKSLQATQAVAPATLLLAPMPTLAACGLSSHSLNSPSRNLHCRPILMAGISLHSAQRHSVRVATPSHFATAAVVRSGSRLDDDGFCIGLIGFHKAAIVHFGSAYSTQGHLPSPWRPSLSARTGSLPDRWIIISSF